MSAHLEWEREGYVLSTDPERLDREAIYGYLVASYWAERIPREVFERSIDNAMCFGLYAPDGSQAGFARIISDHATVAYLGDVFVLEPHRGRGLSKWMMDCIIGHPDLQGLRRWILLTRDAHGLYQQFGFTPLAKPDRWMELWAPDVYKRS
jgi:GNAT superfamily N-acetyltransferase